MDNVIWEVPVHRSLIKRMYWMGVPRGILIAETAALLLGGVIFRTFFIIPVAAAFHFTFRYLGEKDADFLGIFLAGLRHKTSYEGW